MSSGFSATVRPENTRAVVKALEQFPLAIQDRIVKDAIRPFLKKELSAIRARNADKLPPRDARAKMKNFKGTAWGSVAYRTGKADTKGLGGRKLRASYDAAGTGWRSHFTELGTHSWSKSLRRPPLARGKGWKRGLYHRGRGQYLRGTHASELTHAALGPLFRGYVANAINVAVDARNESIRTTRLRRVEEFT